GRLRSAPIPSPPSWPAMPQKFWDGHECEGPAPAVEDALHGRHGRASAGLDAPSGIDQSIVKQHDVPRAQPGENTVRDLDGIRLLPVLHGEAPRDHRVPREPSMEMRSAALVSIRGAQQWRRSRAEYSGAVHDLM